MLNVYLARHGETIWNTQSRMQGRQDSPLTDRGLKQAGSLSDALRSISLDRIWTSPAVRAVRTAEIIRDGQQLNVSILPDERIHEMDLGLLEGMTVDEAQARDPENLKAFFYAPQNFLPLGGETFAEVSGRAADFLDDLSSLALECRQLDQPRHILVISHNITLKALFALMEERPLTMLRDGPPIRQAVLYRAVFNDKWQLSEISDQDQL